MRNLAAVLFRLENSPNLEGVREAHDINIPALERILQPTMLEVLFVQVLDWPDEHIWLAHLEMEPPRILTGIERPLSPQCAHA